MQSTSSDTGPSRDPLLSEAERVGIALAQAAYQTGTVRLANVELGGWSHLVASRQGLFAVNEQGYSLVAHGLFFGITMRGPSIYVFEACGLPRSRSGRGRLIRLTMDRERIVAADVIAAGLDNGCHQIDFIDDRLCVLDTYNQRIAQLGPDANDMTLLQPLLAAENRDWSRGYAHANSLLQVDDRILLLLHNGGQTTGKDSAIAVFDKNWQPLDRWPLPGNGCHNLAVLEDGTLLSCASTTGELIGLDGLRIKVSPMMTRGLSVDADSIVVGASTFSSRRDRHLVPGTITFLDRKFRVRSVLDIPGAPTDIRKLDGCDYSLSGYLRNNVAFVKNAVAWRGAAVGETRLG